jgi:methyl-accepting chemotaxis protein
LTTIIGEISLAGREQTSGIQQVNQAIREMDDTTQQNAALVEEAAAAAESLQEQAASLSRMVSLFKLSDEPVRHEQMQARPKPASKVVSKVASNAAGSTLARESVARAPKLITASSGGEGGEEF